MDRNDTDDQTQVRGSNGSGPHHGTNQCRFHAANSSEMEYFLVNTDFLLIYVSMVIFSDCPALLKDSFESQAESRMETLTAALVT